MSIFIYLWNIDVVELLNQMKINYIIYFHLIMFNCELWTNPSGRLVDRLPYLYGWVDDVQK